jgi:ribose transport system permease protein
MIGAPSERLRNATKGIVGPVLVLGVFLVVYAIIQPAFLSTMQITTLFNGSTVIALAAVGEAIVVIAGGFDLSVGSSLSVINVLLAVHMGQSTGSQALWIVLALAVGVGIGLLNGVLVAILRIPSIVATLATSFFWGGVALLVLKQPGGSVSMTFSNWFTGSHAGVPNALLLLLVVTLMWLAVKRTRLGISIYALGGDEEAAVANGVRLKPSLIGAYCLAGLFYGLAGLFLTAETSSGDPNAGGPLLLTVFTAVVLGGVSLSGGRGDAAAAILGAFILTIITDVLYAMGISSFYTSIFTGAVLILALVANVWGGQGARWLRGFTGILGGRAQDDDGTGGLGGPRDLPAGGSPPAVGVR